MRSGSDVCLRLAARCAWTRVCYQIEGWQQRQDHGGEGQDGGPEEIRGYGEGFPRKLVLSGQGQCGVASRGERAFKIEFRLCGSQWKIEVCEHAQERQEENDCAGPAEDRPGAGAGHSGSVDPRALPERRSGRQVGSVQRRGHAALSGRSRLAIEDRARLACPDKFGPGPEPRPSAESGERDDHGAGCAACGVFDPHIAQRRSRSACEYGSGFASARYSSRARFVEAAVGSHLEQSCYPE